MSVTVSPSAAPAWRPSALVGLGALVATAVLAWGTLRSGPADLPAALVACGCAIAWMGTLAITHLVAREPAWLGLPASAAMATAACMLATSLRDPIAIVPMGASALVPIASGVAHGLAARGRPARKWILGAIAWAIVCAILGALFVVWAIANSGFGGG